MERLSESFYEKSALELAPELLGKFICRNIDGEIRRIRITETECYFGEEDTACHAHKGKTARTKVMYEKGGVAYIYLCYGIHYLLNIVTGEKGHPEAVLIRGVEGFNGPGKLTKALGIDRSLNGDDLIKSDKLWLESDGKLLEYIKAPRIGINYATPEYKDIQWRFSAKLSD